MVIFNWVAPIDNGLPIIGYKIYIRTADLVFIENTTVCDGTDYLVI